MLLWVAAGAAGGLASRGLTSGSAANAKAGASQRAAHNAIGANFMAGLPKIKEMRAADAFTKSGGRRRDISWQCVDGAADQGAYQRPDLRPGGLGGRGR